MTLTALTQQERIIRKLQADGEITTIWAVRHYILRLAARIADLQAAGWVFGRHFVERNGQKTRNYQYVVVKKPKRTKAGAKLMA